MRGVAPNAKMNTTKQLASLDRPKMSCHVLSPPKTPKQQAQQECQRKRRKHSSSILLLSFVMIILTQTLTSGINCDPKQQQFDQPTTTSTSATTTSTAAATTLGADPSPSAAAGTTTATATESANSIDTQDQKLSMTSETPLAAANSTTRNALTTSGGDTTASTMPNFSMPVDYQQRPMPMERAGSNETSRRLINYDTLSSESVSNVTATTSAPSSNQTGVLLTSRATLDNQANSVATGELQTFESLASAVASASEQQQQEVAPTSIIVGGLSDSTASLMEPEQLSSSSDSSSSSSATSRHGRSGQSQNSYSPPATSRLSSYVPNFSLQNSRSHNRQQQQELNENRIGANPLQLPQSPMPTTTTTTQKPLPPFDPIIVCYLGSWSVYRPSLAKFTPENINPFLCTHIIYAFAGLSSKYELKPFDSYNDITQGGYRKFTSLKEHNKQLKTLIAVGGWNEGSAR